MTTHCHTCHRPLTENDRCEIRGALTYCLGCAPSSSNAPRTIWQALLAILGIVG